MLKQQRRHDHRQARRTTRRSIEFHGAGTYIRSVRVRAVVGQRHGQACAAGEHQCDHRQAERPFGEVAWAAGSCRARARPSASRPQPGRSRSTRRDVCEPSCSAQASTAAAASSRPTVDGSGSARPWIWPSPQPTSSMPARAPKAMQNSRRRVVRPRRRSRPASGPGQGSRSPSRRCAAHQACARRSSRPRAASQRPPVRRRHR